MSVARSALVAATPERAPGGDDTVGDPVVGDLLGDVASLLEPEPGVEPEPPLVAALGAIAQQLGVELRRPRNLGSLTGEDGIEGIARASQLRARPVELLGRWWRRDHGPLLLFGDAGEPLAWVRRRGSYGAYDPSRQIWTRGSRVRRAHVAARAWTVYRTLPGRPLGLREVLTFALAGRRGELAWIFVTGLVATLLGMVVPQVTALLMDHAVPDANRRYVLELGAMLVAAACAQAVFRLCQAVVVLRLAVASGAATQVAVWDRVLRLHASFFRRFSSGDLHARVQATSEICQELSGGALVCLFTGMLAFLNLGLLLWYSPLLAAVAAGIGVVVVAATLIIGTKMRRRLRHWTEAEGRRFGFVVQLTAAIGKLRVAGALGRAGVVWRRRYRSNLGLRAASDRLEDRLRLCYAIVPIVSTAILMIVAHREWAAGGVGTGSAGLTLGTFLAFSAAFATFLSSLLALGETVTSLLDAEAKAGRVRPILDAPLENGPSHVDPGRLSGRLALSDVHFGYDDERPVLRGIDLHAAAGEFIAIVGGSGSGKSTVLRLLLGFEAPMQGRVTYDDSDLAVLDATAVRRQLGVVLQGARLDARSIFENLAGGEPLSLEVAWEAAAAAGLADEIAKLPMGMHTLVGNGGIHLSGGQRQRLLLARAFVRRPRIWLLDEATSALDHHTQAVVAASIEKLDVTRVVVAHRWSTIRDADRIYVLDEGTIVQQGGFDALMQDRGGVFARAMQQQMA
ncbi:MAG: NHLP bacteriocin export ABC transporter permease/ATPase subunit [Planctomycetota bacterium]